MTTQNERLLKLRNALGLSTTELADAIGYSQSLISHLENNQAKTLEKRLVRVLHLAFGVNEDWLLTGAGGDEPVFDEKPAIDQESLIAFLRDCLDQLTPANREILMNVVRELAAAEEPAPAKKKQQ